MKNVVICMMLLLNIGIAKSCAGGLLDLSEADKEEVKAWVAKTDRQEGDMHQAGKQEKVLSPRNVPQAALVAAAKKEEQQKEN